MPFDDALKAVVTDALAEALERVLPKHLPATESAQLPNQQLVAALQGGDDEELRRLRRLNSLAYLDAQEAGALLRTGRGQIYRLVNSGALRATKFGRKLVISRVELDRFMSAHEHHAPVPMTPEVQRRLADREGRGEVKDVPPTRTP